MRIDAANWSGEGTFTQVLLEQLKTVPAVVAIRVEDAPATRSDADYNFISNEIFVSFTKKLFKKGMTLPELEAVLTAAPDIGAPDYSDEGMLQYLRTERIIPPYQTRGYKLVELVRVYNANVRRPFDRQIGR
ncbi:MAG TPA: hypothetical protein VFA59_23810 [Vicinamibacterales bacterium]|nr:hypothetical protein [Vicinamibacterales bacterium]